MKFLFDAHHLGLNQTGSETWTRNVVAALAQLDRGREVEYAVTTRGVEELRQLTSSPAHVVATSSLRRLVIDLPRIARSIPSDAVFVTYTAPPTRCPVVVVVHDLSAWHADAGDWLSLRERTQYRTSMGLSCRTAAHVLAPSQWTRHDLMERLGLAPDRVSVATAAVDPHLRALLTATPRRTSDKTFRVLAVGNVLPRKNLMALAEAVGACRRAGIAAQLRIVGSVPKAGGAIASAIRDLLGADVHITGYVSSEQLAQEYRSADVLGFPSLFEGFGIPVVEAMAAGTPVIISNSSSLPEVAGGAAIVCEAGDVGAWQNGLLRLSGDGQLRDHLRQRGLVRSAEFSWKDAATVVLACLRAAAGGGQGLSSPISAGPKS